jgi:hypothetical protein
MSGLRNGVMRTLAALVVCTATGAVALAQDMPPVTIPLAQTAQAADPNPAAPALPANPTPSPTAPAAQKLSEAQLDQLVAPIALYPDPILSQMLMASTYPLEVVEAAHWVHEPANKPLTGDALTAALKNQSWDPSVMALVPFPRILAVMADRVQWTEQLGNAFLAQQNDVMASVQRLRHAALAAGNLKMTPECHCIIQTTDNQISILPSDPKLVCIPIYNPKVVYGAWPEPAFPPIVFPVPVGFAYDPGFWIGFEPPIELAVFGPLWGWGWFDWPGGRIVVDNAAFGRLEPYHAAFAGGTWVHDPAHRRGVAYAGAAVATRFGNAQSPLSVAATRGVPAPVGGRFGTARSAGTFAGPQGGPVNRAGTAPRTFSGAGRFGPSAVHAGAIARSGGPQFAHGHTAPAHFSPGGGPHFAGFAHGPVGGGPHSGGPGGGPHGGPGGHHH